MIRHRKFLSALPLLLLILILFAVQMTANAQTIAWDPLSMDFGQVTIGETEYRTLTLANSDAVDPLSISSVEFGYNDRGMFGLETSEGLPAVLAPGGTMDVIFSFTPTEWSFAMADVLITNNSTNAPSLYYSMLGEGIEGGDPCDPFDNCGGVCTDLQTDLANCGSCGNACPSPENATATCTSGSCGFVCDEGYELIGDNCLPIDKTALELLEELVQFVQDSYADGTLTGVALGNGDTKDRVLVHRFLPVLSFALEDLMLGRTKQTCNSLNFAQLRSDTGWPTLILPPDMVDGPARQEVYDRIIEVIIKLEDCEAAEPITPPTR